MKNENHEKCVRRNEPLTYFEDNVGEMKEGSRSHLKRFEDLTFTDDFMFCKTLTENPDLCKELAELIIGRNIARIVSVHQQKAVEILPDGRGVRFDVCLEGEEEICDIEMQNDVDKKVLPKRSRYYQSAVDIENLVRSEDYTKLKKSYILFLCKEMPFKGKALHKFTFKNICLEDPDLELGDETYKIFMTPAGTADDISKEMKGLMSYLADNKAETDFAEKLENAVKAIKKGEGWRIEYMQLKEKMDAQYEAGREEGREEERENADRDFIGSYVEDGAEDEFIINKLISKRGLDREQAMEKLKKYKKV